MAGHLTGRSAVSRKVVLQDNEEARAVFGPQDAHIRVLDELFSCDVASRGNQLLLQGDEDSVAAVEHVVNAVVALVRKGQAITQRDIYYAASLCEAGRLDELAGLFEEDLALTFRGRAIRVKTLGQKQYVDQIRKRDIVFGVGPAGTGKTYLAVVLASVALRRGTFKRMVLTRPAVEAGENLGFLPGDLQEKVDPYLRPLYDALHDVMGPEQLARSMERGVIEVAPLAYMRGRTLDDSFVILDEAQNTTAEQMKMFLTRLGVGSKMVITGDVTQIDLPRGKRSGLQEAVRILSDLDDIGFVWLDEGDVVRHPLVAQIIRAYSRDDEIAAGVSQ
jgi:phosphate starvation-inducible PhoH-like protein